MERKDITTDVVVITTSKIENDNSGKSAVPAGTRGTICRYDKLNQPYWTEVDFGPTYGKVSVVPRQIRLA